MLLHETEEMFLQRRFEEALVVRLFLSVAVSRSRIFFVKTAADLH